MGRINKRNYEKSTDYLCWWYVQFTYRQKTTEELKNKGVDVLVEAVGVIEGEKHIRNKDYDLFLVSPQTKMYLNQFQSIGKEVDVPVVAIPPQAYIPVPMGIKKMADLVDKEI
ncbi:PTS cellobiose transporter subunit IIB [Ileibacterium valens]|uniref:PTS cellobiose transporter subunit IIB n=1 Tax=Ileibacterium valens TaxID=1862668 RepID=UPI003F7328C4